MDKLFELKKKIEVCDYGAMCDLYKIVKKNKLNKITENVNGVFFNLGKLQESTIKEIKEYLQVLGTYDLETGVFTHNDKEYHC